ncbi:MAG: YajG family lipoprotein, partial [Candidatus Aminicenantes bacterium]|nr:YajG family lipoprotein [Candidatus Aminicenantes bacterium]
MNGEGLAGDHIILTSHESLFSEPGCQLWRGLIRRCLPFLACIFLVGLVGCVVIPAPEHSLLEGRGEIDESDIAFLTVSKTTRENVLLRFGEPDLVLYDQRILIYHWKVSIGYFLVAGGYSAIGGPIPMDYFFMLEFNGEGRLKRSEIHGDIVHEEDYIDKWISPGSEKPPPSSRGIIMIDPIPKGNSQSAIFATGAQPVRFRVGAFCDSRTSPHTDNFIGHKKAAFGVIIADVRTRRPPIDIVRAAVGKQLRVMGHQLVDKDADVTVIGEVAEFGATTSINLLTWDAIGSLDVILEVQLATGTGAKIIRRYKAKHVSKTVLGPSDVNFEQVMRGCLEDMQKQMASDAKLM